MKNPAIENKKVKNISFLIEGAISFCSKQPTKYFVFLLFVLILPNSACESPSLKANVANAQANPAAAENVSSLERDLRTMRDADFDFVYVFRRKDGVPLDAEDKKYLKANSPTSTNRFILSDENKAVIAGSSYKFAAENLDNLQKRFAIENFSKPETPPSPTNQNTGKQ